MKQNLEKELNSAVADLEKRRQQARQAENQEAEREHQITKKSEDALQVIALPALQEVAKSLRKQNISSEVTGPDLRSMTATMGIGPTLQFSFRTTPETFSGRPNGEVAFCGDANGRIVYLREGPPSNSNWEVIDSIAVEALTSEWIQERTVDAVVRALKRLP